MIQEHWLLTEHLGALNLSDDFLSVGVSDMDSHELILGRPYGGCGILYHRSLAPNIVRLKCDTKRFCAILLITHCSRSCLHTLIVNVYLPTDYGTPDSNSEFLECLSKLDGFFAAQSFEI